MAFDTEHHLLLDLLYGDVGELCSFLDLIQNDGGVRANFTGLVSIIFQAGHLQFRFLGGNVKTELKKKVP